MWDALRASRVGTLGWGPGLVETVGLGLRKTNLRARVIIAQPQTSVYGLLRGSGGRGQAIGARCPDPRRFEQIADQHRCTTRHTCTKRLLRGHVAQRSRRVTRYLGTASRSALDHGSGAAGTRDGVGVTVDRPPIATLAPEDAGATKRHRRSVGASAHLGLEALHLDDDRHVRTHVLSDALEADRAAPAIEASSGPSSP